MIPGNFLPNVLSLIQQGNVTEYSIDTVLLSLEKIRLLEGHVIRKQMKKDEKIAFGGIRIGNLFTMRLMLCCHATTEALGNEGACFNKMADF